MTGQSGSHERKSNDFNNFMIGISLADQFSTDIVSPSSVKEDQMNSRRVLPYTVAAAMAAMAVNAAAQAPARAGPAGAVPPPPPRAFAPPVASYNAGLAETRGIVQRFTLTPIGELDGVILADGTEIHLPPHLTTQLAGAVRMGDAVTVQGYRSPSVP